MNTPTTEITWIEPWRDEWPVNALKLLDEPHRSRYFGPLKARFVVYLAFIAALGVGAVFSWSERPIIDDLFIAGAFAVIWYGGPVLAHYLLLPCFWIANSLKPPIV